MSFVYESKNKRAVDIDRGVWVTLFGGRAAGDMREGKYGLGNDSIPINFFSLVSPVFQKTISGGLTQSVHVSRIIIHMNGILDRNYESLFKKKFHKIPNVSDIARFHQDLIDGYRVAMRENGRFDAYITEYKVEIMEQRAANEYMKKYGSKFDNNPSVN